MLHIKSIHLKETKLKLTEILATLQHTITGIKEHILRKEKRVYSQLCKVLIHTYTLHSVCFKWPGCDAQ